LPAASGALLPRLLLVAGAAREIDLDPHHLDLPGLLGELDLPHDRGGGRLVRRLREARFQLHDARLLGGERGLDRRRQRRHGSRGGPLVRHGPLRDLLDDGRIRQLGAIDLDIRRRGRRRARLAGLDRFVGERGRREQRQQGENGNDSHGSTS